MLPLWAPLWLDLQYSSPSLLLIVGLFFTVTTILSRLFVNRVAMERPSITVFDPKPSIAQDMNILRNPFTLILDDQQPREGQLENGVTIKITGDKPFRLTSYWGVNISKFHQSLKKDWSEMRQLIREGSFLAENCLQSSKPEEIEPPIGESITRHIVSENPITSEMLGTSPRACYPLIIILSINDDDSLDDQTTTIKDQLNKPSTSKGNGNNRKLKDEIVCLTSILHIRDDICPMDSNIITQLTKLRYGNVYNLQSLFTPGATVDETSKSVTVCVICQDATISRALLPCRHACICCECYGLIDKCPLCRSYIRSFFFIQQANQPEQSTESTAQSSDSSVDPTKPKPRKRFGFLSLW
ncbi:cell growth regulator with RING finger domain protein 1-like [Panonychus citri]|uniref:cell growth regulator with RING finger domain protein 1-like n=1 Tax=Panonychus citri TaxID=50023 RepID=UPI00230801DC|nr:cell growth regulator with RING finger domain protein 1-like [Panonychus citri]